MSLSQRQLDIDTNPSLHGKAGEESDGCFCCSCKQKAVIKTCSHIQIEAVMNYDTYPSRKTVLKPHSTNACTFIFLLNEQEHRDFFNFLFQSTSHIHTFTSHQSLGCIVLLKYTGMWMGKPGSNCQPSKWIMTSFCHWAKAPLKWVWCENISACLHNSQKVKASLLQKIFLQMAAYRSTDAQPWTTQINTERLKLLDNDITVWFGCSCFE